jgi:putative tricarboxylic transport membrane protein
MYQKKLSTDVYIGIIMVIFGLLVAILSWDLPESPRRFPLMASGMFIFLALLILYQGIKKTRYFQGESKSVYQWAQTKYAFIMLLMIIAYVVLINLISFFPATVFFVPAAMIYMKVRKWQVIVLSTLSLNLFIWWLFVLQLQIRLP